jgi:hypothetical protein
MIKYHGFVAKGFVNPSRQQAVMVTEDLKSASMTNRYATPQVQNSSGVGAPGVLRMADDFVTTTSGKTVGSTYRMVSIPTDARVKRVTWEAGAMTQGPFDLGVYYQIDAPGHTGEVVLNAADFFGSALSAASAVPAGTEVTNEQAEYPLSARGKQLWDALGLTADPGGYFDIVFTSTNTITAGALLGVRVEFVM